MRGLCRIGAESFPTGLDDSFSGIDAELSEKFAVRVFGLTDNDKNGYHAEDDR